MLTSALTRNRVFFTLTFLLLFFTSFLTVFAEAIPSTVPPDGIYDPSDYLDQETHDAITKFNKDHTETDLQPQLGVAIVDYLDQDIESVANQTARNWKVGYKETNYGILLVIGVKDRKMRTEVSDRAATQLTDWKASELNDVLKPYFRNEQYSQGIQAYVAKLTKHFDHLVKKSSGTWDDSKEVPSLTPAAEVMLIILGILTLVAMLGTLIVELLDSRDSKYRTYDYSDDTEKDDAPQENATESNSSQIIYHGSSADTSNASDTADLLWTAAVLHHTSSSSSDDSDHSSSSSSYSGSSSRSSSSYSGSSSRSSYSSSSSSYSYSDDSDYSSSSSSSFSSSDWGGGGFGGGGASGGW